jgi:hypothetical protein
VTKIKKIIYVTALDSRQTTNYNNNQKHVGMMEEGKEMRFNWQGARGKHNSIVLGAIKLGYHRN